MPIIGDQGLANKAEELKYDIEDATELEDAKIKAKENYANSIEKQKSSNQDAMKDDGEIGEDGLTLKQRMIALAGSPWPHKASGFLLSELISPTVTTSGNPTNPTDQLPTKFVYSEDYKFKDWRGQLLTDNPPKNIIKTEDRFKVSRKTKSDAELINSPYSMRDVPLIFNDPRYDYFKFGLQTIDNLTPIENPESGRSTLRLDNFKGTPWEQSDPVFYGFDIIFDSISSPLLNGAVSDFINNYSTISEISSKKQVYEEFKNQFVKFFRTNATVKVDPEQIRITTTDTKTANLDSNTTLKQPGKKAYFAYYLKKITGLDLLIEANKGSTTKYTPAYRTDMINLDMTEDVTLSLGTLIHLYKLLYWSKPNGKALIPDNLLRFNCQIIISECRNMNRVQKDLATGNIQVVKDNLSRWVYNLRECQFWFDKIPVDNVVDMGAEPKSFDVNTISFDFKYSSVKLERFVPVLTGNLGWGTYYSFDNGSMWRIGNTGARSSRNGGASAESSNPPFFSTDLNRDSMNGVAVPYVIAVYGDSTKLGPSTKSALKSFTDDSDKNSGKIAESLKDSATIEKVSKLKPGQSLSKALSSSTFKKIKDKFSGITGSGKFSKITQPASNNSKFFDAMGQLPGNFPKNPAPLMKMINQTLLNIWGSTKGPYDPDNVSNAADGGLFSNIYTVKPDRSRFLANRLNDDSQKGIKNYASHGRGWDLTGYDPPVPFRAFANGLGNSNAQSNITYLDKMNPPVRFSLSRNRGKDPSGDLYIFKNQISDFAGGPLGDQITSGGKNEK
jgi:hypothetical protein